MMHKWEFEDGTVARWTNKGTVLVSGESKLANSIRESINFPVNLPCSVFVHHEAGGMVDLDMSSIWLVDRLMRNEADRLFLKIVSSTYTPRDEDMPPDAAEKVYRSRNWPPLEDGEVS